MDSRVVTLVENSRDKIISTWMDEMDKVREQHRLTHISSDVFTNTNRKISELIWENLVKNEEQSMEPFKEIINRLLEMGLPLSYLTQGVQTFRRLTMETCLEQIEHSQDIQPIFSEVDRWYDPIVNQLVSSSVETWEKTVSTQRSALKELSAPLIPVFEGISVMPLVGTIDTERAKQIMENLLEGVMEHRSQVVLIDITGVPIVDTMVAHHIIQAVEAVRLIGAKCILVGIRPEIAQTIVTLGIVLSEFHTKSTLQTGMQAALEMTGREIADLSQEGSA